MPAFAAADLGASSGRVIVGLVDAQRLELREVHRFPNEPVVLPDGLHWNVLGLYGEILTGLAAARQAHDGICGVAVDSWAIDYGLVTPQGGLLGVPFHYRDGRGPRAVAALHRRISPQRLFAVNGLQHLPFTTIYQLAADAGGPLLALADALLLIPDLIGYWLTGTRVSELTNASTTGLLDAGTGRWSGEVMAALGLRSDLLAPLVEPGHNLGPLTPAVREQTGLGAAVAVSTVASHDTASAVVGVPATSQRFAYISCGTWALVGVETRAPIITQASRSANFTNERGVDGTTRLLRNVMGLWILQGVLADLRRQGTPAGLDDLLAAADRRRSGAVFDPDRADFLAAGPMIPRVTDALRAADQPVPTDAPGLVRCVLDSLAVAFADRVREAVELSGQAVDVVHLVGGGAANSLLCQLTADRAGLPVVAGPVEATAIGNLLIQARTHGALDGGLTELRSLVRRTQPLARYEPRV